MIEKIDALVAKLETRKAGLEKGLADIKADLKTLREIKEELANRPTGISEPEPEPASVSEPASQRKRPGREKSPEVWKKAAEVRRMRGNGMAPAKIRSITGLSETTINYYLSIRSPAADVPIAPTQDVATERKEPQGCPHHWDIPSVSDEGTTQVTATCSKCGETRTFKNFIDPEVNPWQRLEHTKGTP